MFLQIMFEVDSCMSDVQCNEGINMGVSTDVTAFSSSDGWF